MGRCFRRFRSQIIFKYTSAVRSKICRSLLYAWCLLYSRWPYRVRVCVKEIDPHYTGHPHYTKTGHYIWSGLYCAERFYPHNIGHPHYIGPPTVTCLAPTIYYSEKRSLEIFCFAVIFPINIRTVEYFFQYGGSRSVFFTI